ncbi:MAG TPA: hypothetical protein VFT05_11015, partial [Burkholderiaceae bacterium]|nr:hypothetical protein [Burkholderiaceae bacterium]
MLKHSVMALAMGAAVAAPMAHAADKTDKKELAAIRAQIRQMQTDYEARLQSLEQRLQQAQAATAAAQAQLTTLTGAAPAAAVAGTGGASGAGNGAPAALAQQGAGPQAPAPYAEPAPAAPVGGAAPPANLFNPNISMILGGTLQNLSQDPTQYRLQGFIPSGGDAGPGKRGFSLGESELTMAANIDPQFAGQLTFSLAGDNTVSVEEAFMQTRDMPNGVNLKAGRFLSSIGYLNGQHTHAWDFVDAPLAYQAFLGGQYKPDGVQAKWLAPLDQFLEIGVEAGDGAAYPGNDRNKNGAGAWSVFAHLGDDIGDSASYRAGVSYLHTGAQRRSYEDGGLNNAFSGKSATWIADAVYKWAPNGNPTHTNFKLLGEYFRRKEDGSLDYASGTADAASGSYRNVQSGWYAQGVYQFMPYWRVGARYDRLSSGTPRIGLVDSGALALGSFPVLEGYNPARSSVMVDYSPSEFSRLRLQL